MDDQTTSRESGGTKFRKLGIAWAEECANGYRSASSVAICATLVYVALIVADALAALSLLGQIQLLNVVRSGMTIPPGQAEANDAQQRLFGTLQLSLSFAATILLLVWVYRANRNAHKLGANGMSYTPAWSVAWFFIPVASVFMPYRVLRELWKASSAGAGAHWQRAPVPSILGAWWAVWFAHCIIQYSPWSIVTGHLQLAQIPSFGSLWFDHLWEFSWGLLIAEIVEIAASVLTIVVIVRITNLQEPIQWRFSLRTLLIATTLVAALLGLAVYVARR